MRKKDFAQLAKELNLAWRGNFTEEELKENIDCYWSDYKASKKAGEAVGCIARLLELLDEDNDPDSCEWMYRIRQGIKGEKVGTLFLLCDSNQWLLLKIRPQDLERAEQTQEKAIEEWYGNDDYWSDTFYECFDDLFGCPSEIIDDCYRREA